MISGTINRHRPPAVAIREMWERALCLAVWRGDLELARQLVRMYETQEESNEDSTN